MSDSSATDQRTKTGDSTAGAIDTSPEAVEGLARIMSAKKTSEVTPGGAYNVFIDRDCLKAAAMLRALSAERQVAKAGEVFVAALFVETGGVYYGLPGVDPWDERRDARKYAGPHPVVAHPPCQLWTRFAHVNYKRWGGEHNRPGNDGGCFEAALAAVKSFGGVLEHPAFSDAWSAFKLPRPRGIGWRYQDGFWVCEVWQSAYGHKARKRTWLLFCGPSKPAELNWSRPKGTHQIGFHDQRGKARNKPTVSGKAASATPTYFRDALLALVNPAVLPNHNTGQTVADES